MHNILLVEDNEVLQEVNKDFLEEVGGYNVRLAMNLDEARKSVIAHPPDLIVLDIMLPDGSGLDFLKELKAQNKDIPVLLLTAMSESSDEVRGIQEGGDDYIAKPYNNDVLLVRIVNLLRRVQRTDALVKSAERAVDIAEYGPLIVNHITQRVYLYGEDALLTPKEFALLAFFLKNIGKQFTAEKIYEAVWGQYANHSITTVRVRIKGLRDKLRMEDEVAVAIDTVARKFYVCRLTRE